MKDFFLSVQRIDLSIFTRVRPSSQTLTIRRTGLSSTLLDHLLHVNRYMILVRRRSLVAINILIIPVRKPLLGTSTISVRCPSISRDLPIAVVQPGLVRPEIVRLRMRDPGAVDPGVEIVLHRHGTLAHDPWVRRRSRGLPVVLVRRVAREIVHAVVRQSSGLGGGVGVHGLAEISLAHVDDVAGVTGARLALVLVEEELVLGQLAVLLGGPGLGVLGRWLHPAVHGGLHGGHFVHAVGAVAVAAEVGEGGGVGAVGAGVVVGGVAGVVAREEAVEAGVAVVGALVQDGGYGGDAGPGAPVAVGGVRDFEGQGFASAAATLLVYSSETF